MISRNVLLRIFRFFFATLRIGLYTKQMMEIEEQIQLSGRSIVRSFKHFQHQKMLINIFATLYNERRLELKN